MESYEALYAAHMGMYDLELLMSEVKSEISRSMQVLFEVSKIVLYHPEFLDI